MTRLPFVLDRVAEALAVDPPSTNQHHLAILETARDCYDLDEALGALVGESAEGALAIERPDTFAHHLAQRLRLEGELTRLVRQPCCCAPVYESDEGEEDALMHCGSEPEAILHACRDAFAAAGDPPALTEAELIGLLSGISEGSDGRVPYAGLSENRLSKLLVLNNVYPCAMGEDRQAKGYRRGAVLFALQRSAS
ncbi:hypothetical protein ACFYXF_03835 [Streptomyces sp. NPDC002680]|uniref:hypothetical protein n=1 Tax=Streptomyces sp. NPDC002680 TaxID=3364659 RepID=UPI0036977BE8